MRICRACGKRKELVEFYKLAHRGPNVRRRQCKKCVYARNLLYRRKRYRTDKENKQKMLARARNYRDKNIERVRATDSLRIGTSLGIKDIPEALIEAKILQLSIYRELKRRNV